MCEERWIPIQASESDLCSTFIFHLILRAAAITIFLVSFQPKRVTQLILLEWETVLGLYNSPKKKATLTFTFSTCHDIDRSPQQRARGLKETFKRVHPSATRDFNFLFFLWKIWFCLISCSFFLHSYESFIISREEIRWSIEPCARRSSTFLIWFGYQKKTRSNGILSKHHHRRHAATQYALAKRGRRKESTKMRLQVAQRGVQPGKQTSSKSHEEIITHFDVQYRRLCWPATRWRIEVEPMSWSLVDTSSRPALTVISTSRLSFSRSLEVLKIFPPIQIFYLNFFFFHDFSFQLLKFILFSYPLGAGARANRAENIHIFLSFLLADFFIDHPRDSFS